MDAKTLRTAAALLAVLGLLAAAAPAAATVGGPAQGETGIGPDLLHHLTAWLAGLWPGAAPTDDDDPAGLVQRLGSNADPNGEPASASTAVPTASGDDDPTAEPQLGPVADPNG